MARIAFQRGMLPQVGVRSGGSGRREAVQTGENEPARPSERWWAENWLLGRTGHQRRVSGIKARARSKMRKDADTLDRGSNARRWSPQRRAAMVMRVVVEGEIDGGWSWRRRFGMGGGCSQDGSKRAQRRDRIPSVRPVRKRGGGGRSR
ncbi:hypothetical protein GX51_02128 [Blastomyces parvus]|uniref:Uncharacterized protein n=1 Tax=Blastomyces parvus TaxID=2060905 RepID=A0A2B7XDR1_9EURO|nr:hypothetical protein GX51_02128 [Blastomyces parvus]